ncbi:MAG: hypothetical protein L7U87_06210 [Chlamydiales bacterium]|nr:hypothetical protein [Chlamydiales bacterium]
MCIRGKGGSTNKVEARQLYLQLASYSLDSIPESTKETYVIALLNLTLMLKNGDGGEVDIEGAKKCFKKIASYPRKELEEEIQRAMKELEVALIKNKSE